VGVLRRGGGGKSDHELGFIALLAQEAEQDEGRGETSRPAVPEVETAVDRSREESGREPSRRTAGRTSEPTDERRQRLPHQQGSNDNEPNPDPQGETPLVAQPGRCGPATRVRARVHSAP
jgi:hypothetical protein